jgi:hypothetical protein
LSKGDEGAGTEEANGGGGGVEIQSIIQCLVEAFFGGKVSCEGVARRVSARLVKLANGARPEGLLD